MFAAVPALYAAFAAAFAATSALAALAGDTFWAVVAASLTGFSAWSTYVCIKRSRGE